MVNINDHLNVINFLQDLQAQGVELWVEGDKLKYRSTKEVLTPQVLSQIKQYKLEILDLLRQKVEPKQPYPLSLGQQALWFLYQLAPESTAYNIMYAVRLKPNIDTAILEQAFTKTIARHPSLRSTYKTEDGQPVQQVSQDLPVQFKVTQTSDLSQDYLDNWLAENADRPFKLEQGDLIRAHVLNRSDQTDSIEKKEFILLLVAHHIAIDFWSLDILIDDLCLLYQSIEQGTSISLPPLTVQYQDYVRQEQSKLASPELDRQWDYWQQKLAGELPVLNLPTDKPRPPVQTYNGVSQYFTLNEELSQGIRELAKKTGTTPYAIVLAAFQVLLLRYTNQSELLIGCPMAGRIDPELEKIVGYFVNPVVLRANIAGNPTFEELITKTRQTLFEALDYQELPFPLLVKKLQPERDPSRSPLFQAALVWDRSRQGEDNSAEATRNELILDYVAMEQRGAELDILLTLFDSGESLAGTWRYNTDLFATTTIERMAGNFQTLLEGIVANPERPITELPILTKAEEHQLLIEWNKTQTDYSQDKCIHFLFEAQVAKTPDAVAVVFEEQQLTYQELNNRANQLAKYLCNLGVKPDVLVGISVERSIEMLVGLLGILKAGGAYVPLDPKYPQERLSYMLADSGIKVLLTQQSLLETLPPTSVRVVCLDTDWQMIECQPEDNLERESFLGNLAYVIYTSGSTGKPKGVLIEHQGLCNLAQVHRNIFDVKSTSNVLQFASVSFDASVSEIFMALTSGATLVLGTASQLMPGDDLRQILVERGITHVTLPPSVLAVLSINELPALGQIIVAGETCPSELVNQWSVGRRFFNAYGPTESTVCATIAEINEDSEKITIGRPIANTQVYILNSYLQPVPIGVIGELYIGGDGLARGYLNRRELTAEKFMFNPFSNQAEARLYKTGDLARYLPDGSIEFRGRADNLVKIRGFRIELGEIETTLAQHSDVSEAVVIVREDVPGDQQLVAYIVSESQSTATSSKLRSFLKAKLPNYMVPSAFVTLTKLPLTPNGKINRRALPKPDGSNNLEKDTYVAPRNELERQIATVWKQVLHLEKVGTHENFFDLGGHSLLLAQVQSKLGKQLQGIIDKDISVMNLFTYPTISELAQYLASKDSLEETETLVQSSNNQARKQIKALKRQKMLRRKING